MTKVAFEIDEVERVEIHCDPLNEISAAIPKKLGFSMDGIIRGSMLYLNNKMRDTMIWTLLKDEYPESPAADIGARAYDVMGRRLL